MKFEEETYFIAITYTSISDFCAKEIVLSRLVCGEFDLRIEISRESSFVTAFVTCIVYRENYLDQEKTIVETI